PQAKLRSSPAQRRFRQPHAREATAPVLSIPTTPASLTLSVMELPRPLADIVTKERARQTRFRTPHPRSEKPAVARTLTTTRRTPSSQRRSRAIQVLRPTTVSVARLRV